MAPAPVSDDARPASPLYRAVWRWHFFAGLACLPFLLLLAVTGALYLFNAEIESVLYRDLLRVTAPARATPLSPEGIVALAIAPGERAIRYVPPATASHSAEVGVVRAGKRFSVYVDPYTGHRLGDVADEARIMPLVKQLHSLAIAGRLANYLIEIVAGWTIVLVVTGAWLWWPRGRTGGVASVRGRPAQRLWWRDLHAVTGAGAGGLILFLALTGMPWSAFWGQQFGALAQRWGLGMPAHVWGSAPQSSRPLAEQGPLPWTLSRAAQAQSLAATAPAPIGLDAAVRRFAELGLAPGHRIALPVDDRGVYSAMLFPDDVRAQRVIHLDQYSGRPLVDVGYADYGAIAKVTEWGVSLHTGRQFGRANQWLMLAGCLALIALVVTSVVMWGKRRPRGRLAAPARRDGDRVAATALALAAGLGLLFPLLGASMLLAALLPWPKEAA